MEEPVVIGEWRKISQLGSGGFGVVTLWRSETTNDCFAIKKCKMAMPSSLTSRQKERWKQEVEIMKQINNQNIVTFKELPDFFYSELNKYNPTKLPLLSMEYCSKGNLRTYLKSWENLRGFEEVEVRHILLDISNAIEYLHNLNITHRDIKPENIVMQFCDERPNNTVYKIIDLGYAKELGTIVSFVGTLPYLAPEIFQTENYTKNVDYWSFGMTAYEIITGVLPFLPTLEPPKRFEYIKKKSDEDICIYTKNGNVKYSKEILQKVWISSVLKKNIERWLRLVLHFDPKKRGMYQNTLIDVILELKEILSKKIVNVMFLYTLTMYSYEVTESSTFEDLKRLVVSTDISLKDLVVLHDTQSDIYCDDDKILECINNIDHTTKFYIFSCKSYIDVGTTISFPSVLEQLFKSRTDFTNQELRELTLQLIFFIRTKRGLLNFFNKSVHALIFLTERMFDVSKRLFEKVRHDLSYLMAKVECYDELTNNFLNNSSIKDQFLNNYRKLLRQIKELVENVNGMTDKFFQLSNNQEKLSTFINTVNTILEGNKFDDSLSDAISVYEKIQKSSQMNMENSSKVPIYVDLARILSQLLRKWRKGVLSNAEISNLCLLSTKLQISLKKHYKWCMALDKEIYRVSKELHDIQRLINQGSVNVPTDESESLVSIIFPNDLSQKFLEAEALIRENRELRYTIQDKLDETSCSLVKIQREVLMLYNGVSMRYSDI